MSNKDIKKGIAIQAEADAAKVEKLSKGLSAHKAALESLESGQGEIRDAMGIVLDDMSAGEAKMLFDLQIKKTPGELDETEKHVLCACIYALLSAYGQNAPSQISFYSNLEKYLGVSERKDDFDFFSLNNIDSHTDRIVILKAVCSFLYLNSESFAFLKDQENFSWLFAFASVKDIRDVCSAINSEHAVLGVNGILGNYDPLLAPKREMQEEYYRLKSEIDGTAEMLPETANEENNCFEELSSLINRYLADESAFGKGVAYSEEEFKRELANFTPDVAFDSFIAASKIDKGSLIFTTHSLYLKADGLLKNNYAELPYSCIQTDKIITEVGRKTGTRKITIPVTDGVNTKLYCIDDSKLEEEKLRDLLIEISKSGVAVSDNDKEIRIDDLSEQEKALLLSAAIYAVNQEGYPLADLYVLAQKWNVDNWEALSTTIKNDKDFEDAVRACVSGIPYPSERITSLAMVEFVMALVARGNTLLGEEATKLSIKMENRIRAFASEEIPSKSFNIMLKDAQSLIKDEPHDAYLSLKGAVAKQSLSYSDSIITGVDLIIARIEAGLDYKAKQSIKKAAKDVAELANNLFEKKRNH